MSLTDPFEEAKLWPLSYLHVKYLEKGPSPDMLYRLDENASYVINLDRDTERMSNFQKLNDKVPYIQRFSASKWPPDDAQTQQDLERKYPWIRMSSRAKKFGDAGCTLSHIRLLQQLLASSDQDYYFIFEDDAKILEPLASDHSLMAPSDADAVLLVATATKAVRIKYENDDNKHAARVMQGYGALGYIITRRGAQKLLNYLERRADPIDVALLSSGALRVYWTEKALVAHKPGVSGSVRSKLNG